MVGASLLFSLYWAYQWFGIATVTIQTTPPGAVVSVDGRQRGITPIERLEVDAGRHRVIVEHSHFAPEIIDLSVRRGDHEQFALTLQPGQGTFELLSNPKGAWVEIDGERLPAPTPTQWEGPSGSHVIRMGQAERHVVEATHEVRHDETVSVTMDLNIDPHGNLTVSTRPAGAKVEFVGEDIAYKPDMRIRIGEYALKVSKQGYASETFRYKVRYGNNLKNVTLERAYGNLSVSANSKDVEIDVAYTLDDKRKREIYTPNMKLPVGPVEVRGRALGYRTQHKKVNLTQSGARLTLNLKPMQVTPGEVITDTLQVGGAGPQMIVVPAGRFVMGDAAGSLSEQPLREVTLSQPFAVSRYEITVGEYLVFANATNTALSPKLDTQDPKRSLGYVTFAEADAYARWLSAQSGQKYRLPSEAEWEYVARAGSASRYSFGDDPLQLCQYANVADLAARSNYRDWDVLRCDDGQVRVTHGGLYEPNPFGVYDIYGNVAEWVADCGMPSYARAPSDGSTAAEGLGCSSHGYRGGSWDSMAIEASSAYRNSASTAIDDRGIRLVREL